MSIQSNVNMAMGAVAGAGYAIKKNLMERQKMALKKAEEAKQAKIAQRRNFMKALKEQETSYGIKVGTLGPEAQKAIAKQYTPYQRKKLMDEFYGGKK